MTPAERIEEAHGLWELAAAGLAVAAQMAIEQGGPAELLRPYAVAERRALAHWIEVSTRAQGGVL